MVPRFCQRRLSRRGIGAPAFARIRDEFRRLADENPGKTIAIFTHATPIRAMLTEWQEQPIEVINTTPWPTNASVTVVDYLDDGGYALRMAAYDGHLREAGLSDVNAAEPIDAVSKMKKDAV